MPRLVFDLGAKIIIFRQCFCCSFIWRANYEKYQTLYN